MATQTRTVVFARAAQDRRSGLLLARLTGTQETPETSQVEVVQQTTKTALRSNHTRSGAPDEVTEQVLATLTVEAAQHLIATLSGALIDALDTRPFPTETTVLKES